MSTNYHYSFRTTEWSLIMITGLLAKFGYVKKEDFVNELNFARTIGKRLDEHREVVEAIEQKTDLLIIDDYHISHLATQDDYLMRLFKLVHGVWPNVNEALTKDQRVRERPIFLGKCRLPEFPQQQK